MPRNAEHASFNPFPVRDWHHFLVIDISQGSKKFCWSFSLLNPVNQIISRTLIWKLAKALFRLSDNFMCQHVDLLQTKLYSSSTCHVLQKSKVFCSSENSLRRQPQMVDRWHQHIFFFSSEKILYAGSWCIIDKESFLILPLKVHSMIKRDWPIENVIFD